MTFFWDKAPWGLDEIYRHYRGAYCLHIQVDFYRLQGAISLKTAVFILAGGEPEISVCSVTHCE
jgi:hypothetical protein